MSGRGRPVGAWGFLITGTEWILFSFQLEPNYPQCEVKTRPRSIDDAIGYGTVNKTVNGRQICV